MRTTRVLSAERLAPVLVAAVLALTGCSTGTTTRTAAGTATGTASRPADDISPATPLTAPGRAPAGTIPGDFPLARGLHVDADAALTGPDALAPGLRLADVCHLTAWPGPSLARLAVDQTAHETETVREVELYAQAAQALAVLHDIRRQVADCPHQTSRTVGGELVFTSLQDALPAAGRSTAFQAIAPDGSGGYVVVLERLRRVVLGIQAFGSWTPSTARAEVAALFRHVAAPLRTPMCLLSAGPC